MSERLEQARKRLAELEKIENPDAWERGSIAYERERIKHLERVTAKDK